MTPYTIFVNDYGTQEDLMSVSTLPLCIELSLHD